MEMNTVFGAYDIRGVLVHEINEDFAYRLGLAFGSYLCPDAGGKFLVGHDARPTSLPLANALSNGILKAGCDVTFAGLTSTPLMYWWGAKGNFDGTIAVTASHLSAEYGGFKLCKQQAVPVGRANGLLDIAGLMETGKITNKNKQVLGHLTNESPLKSYVLMLQSYLQLKTPMKIAIDTGHGAGGPEVQAVFQGQADIEILPLGLEPTGDSKHRPSNPLEPGALGELSKLVTQANCNFGVALDGDADRAIFVDERGRMIPPDVFIALIGTRLFSAKPGSRVLFDLRSRRMVSEALSMANLLPIRTQVGHSNIHAAMKEHQAVFAGELSGHYYYGDLYGTDNALRTLIEVINIVSGEKSPLSELVAPFLSSPTSGEINLKVEDPSLVLKKLEQVFIEHKQDHLDGLSVEGKDWSFNIRPSKTEPLLRLTVNATKDEILKENLDRLLSIINDRGLQ